MRMNAVPLLFAWLLVEGACGSERAPEKAKATEAQRLLDDYAKGVFDETPALAVESGWAMDVRGKERTRSFLQRQADHLIAVGRAAVPTLLERLDDKERYMRYICAYSLEKITGLAPTFYYFGDPHKPSNGENDWFEKARDTWKRWHEQHHD
jgi:hypothetical protein